MLLGILKTSFLTAGSA